MSISRRKTAFPFKKKRTKYRSSLPRPSTIAHFGWRISLGDTIQICVERRHIGENIEIAADVG